MKNLVSVLMLCIIFGSCGDEISYPATYEYDSSLEESSSIVTKEPNTNVIEISEIKSINVSICDFFNTISGNQVPLKSVTLLSETELELTIDDGSGMNSIVKVPYSEQDGEILEEFNLSFDEENRLVSEVCNKLFIAPSENNFLAEATYCVNSMNANDRALFDFFLMDFVEGDTVAYCIMNHIYTLK